MATVTEIKEELKFNRELTQLLDAIKNGAIFQFRSLHRRREKFAIFGESLEGFLRMIDLEGNRNIFTYPASGRLGIIMITSDKGFMGGLNLRVVKTAMEQKGSADAELIMVGERGGRYLKEMGRDFVSFKGAEFDERYARAAELKNHIIKGVKEERFGKVIIAYPNPVSFMIQRVEIVKVLPLSGDRGKGTGESDIIIESPIDGIISYLAEQLITSKLVEVLEDSKLSEFAARAVHLEESTRDLMDKEGFIKHRYFHAYHEIIDKGIRELFSAQIIRKKAE